MKNYMEKKMYKNILVTGGLGFIGTSLVETLLEDENNFVTIVDDQSTSMVDANDFYNNIPMGRCVIMIETVDNHFKTIYDSRNGADILYDEIYHLASPVGPASVINQGGEMIREVVRDAYHLIDYCKRFGCRLLDVSTSEIYGGGDADGYCSEETPKIFPAKLNMRIEYAMAKLAAETAIVNSCIVGGLDAVIIRPFNVAGQRQSSQGGFVVPRFVQQAFHGFPYTLFNYGEDIRAFTHVQDIVDGLILAMERGKSGTVYNIGNPNNKVTIKELALHVNMALGYKNDVEYIDPIELYGKYYASAKDKYPDATKAMDELGWKPTRHISDIILDYFKEFKRQMDNGILLDDILKTEEYAIKK